LIGKETKESDDESKRKSPKFPTVTDQITIPDWLTLCQNISYDIKTVPYLEYLAFPLIYVGNSPQETKF